MMILKRFLLLSSLCVLSAGVAGATTISYTLATSAALPVPAGTITLTETGTGPTTVTVQLNSGYSFRQAADANHTTFAFDLNAVPTGITGLTSGFTYEPVGSYNDVPYGSFPNAVICTSCGPGYPATPVTLLSFTLNGIQLSNFISNSAGHPFAVDLVTSTGATGAVTVGDPTTVGGSVPEPSSLMLLGTGVMGLAGFVRRRMA